MQTQFIAEIIVSIDERLLGVELLTRFIASDGRPLHPEFVISSWDLDRKRLFLYEQCGNIAIKQTWFEQKNLFCTLNIDQQMAFLIRHDYILRESANKQVISSQADSLIKISRIWADFFPANTSNQPI
ncbi:hypothetical protein M8U45_05495 [Enterobacter hormaechei]|nr:hypothetical protein [Enterobacter hormaechei]